MEPRGANCVSGNARWPPSFRPTRLVTQLDLRGLSIIGVFSSTTLVYLGATDLDVASDSCEIRE